MRIKTVLLYRIQPVSLQKLLRCLSLDIQRLPNARNSFFGNDADVAFGLYLFGGLLELNPSLTYPNAPPYLFALCAVTALLALAAVLCFRWARRGKARGD